MQTIKKCGSTMAEYLFKFKGIIDVLASTDYNVSKEDHCMYLLV